MNDNKLIAEFMGHKTNWGFNKDSILYMPHGEGNSSSNSVSIPYNKLQYHTSWDWLIPVILEIEVKAYRLNLPQLIDVSFYDEIHEVYWAVLEFIKTYNNEEKENTKRVR